MLLQGTLKNPQIKKSAKRVIAISASSEILDTAIVDRSGNWELLVKENPQTIIVQCKDTCLAAVAGSPSVINDMSLPPLSTVSFELENYEEGIALYADPLSLEDFPDQLIDALRKNKNNIIDLHIGEYSFISKEMNIEIQNGKYRFSAGKINFHSIGGGERQNLYLESVSDMATGNTILATEGEVRILINKDVRYKLNLVAK